MNEITTRSGFGFWGWLDYWSHRIWLPERLRGWICDRFDRSLDGAGYDYEQDRRYCGKRAMAAGVEVVCWRPADHGHVHQGPRAEHEQFTWNENQVRTLEPRR